MLCTSFLAKAHRVLGASAVLLLAILALPPGASAKAHGTAVAGPAHAAIVRAGDGYASPHGSRSVRWIQRRLHALGYHAGPTDGLFGPLTEGAVTRFQADRHLATDGVAGPATIARLRAGARVMTLGAGYPMRHGSLRVRTIQKRLRTLGYTPGPVDGRFGPRTAGAVAQLQADHRLAADGAVGPRTSKLLLAHARPQRPTHVADRIAPSPPDMPHAERPLTLRPAPAALPHGPPVEAVLIALAAIGLAVFTASYVQTRVRVARAARHRQTIPAGRVR